MNEGRLKHRLALAAIVLALWTTDVVASGHARCMRTGAWLYGLSIEQLMEVAINSADDAVPYEPSSPEAPVPQAAKMGVSENTRRVNNVNDEIEASLKPMLLDDVSYGR